MEHEGVLRRSLRKINPFKANIFRLPATPRLSRSRRVGACCEDGTGWNFERTATTRESFNNNNDNNINGPLSRSSSACSETRIPQQLPTVRPNQNGQRRQPQSPPPDPVQAESSISRHVHSLLLRERREQASLRERRASPEFTRRDNASLRERRHSPDHMNHLLLQLPVTRYGADGHISHALWERDATASPNLSTISLLNTHTHYRTQSIRSAGSGCYSRNGGRMTLPFSALYATTQHEKKETSGLSVKPIFYMHTTFGEAQLEQPFLGREWVFREIYESSIVDRVPVLLISGVSGAGKTSLSTHIVQHTAFYSPQITDTLDSGCVLPLPSHSEWLRAVASRVVAYHFCTVQDAITCSIVEFVCNLGATLASSPVLRSYADILRKDSSLENLLRVENCLKIGPDEVFRKAIAEPLHRLTSTDQGCLLILVDGIDEAEYHRTEAGHSIETFFCKVIPLLPEWIKWVICADTALLPPMGDTDARIIRIDDDQMNDRVARDIRSNVELRMGACHNLQEGLLSGRQNPNIDPIAQFANRVISQSCGNSLYVSLLLSLADSDLLRPRTLSSALLPSDLSELYLLFFNLLLSSQSLFERCSPLLCVLLASLRPLFISDLSHILTLATTEDPVSEQEVHNRCSLLSPFVCVSSSGLVSLHHSAFREWILKNHPQCKFTINIREGHLLLSVYLTLRGVSDDGVFELAHYLLKANPHKYFPGRLLPADLPLTKDCQIRWLQRATVNLDDVLLSPRNILFPNTKVTRLLLLSGASANAVDPQSCLSVLALAAQRGDPSLVSTLIQYGAEVNPESGELPVVCAAASGHIDAVQILHQHGALQGDAATAATVAGAAAGHSKVVSFLFQCVWHDTEAKKLAAQSALDAAAGKGHIATCEFLLDECQDSCSLSLSSALVSACLAGQADVVQVLLARGVVLSEVRWPDDDPALCYAVESGSWDLVVAVLAHSDENIDKKDTHGHTALIKAAKKGHVGLVDMLLNRGASITAVDDNRWTALMHAVSIDNVSCVQLLIEKGAVVDACSAKDGNTIVHVACASASRPIIDRLLETGVSIEERNAEGERPIEIAIRKGKAPAVTALLRRGARLRSFTWVTAKEHHPDTLLVLLQKLLDDAALLYRKRKTEDAMHRLRYAEQKCDELLEEPQLSSKHLQMKKIKMQILLAIARAKRRSGKVTEAIKTCGQAALLADSDSALFDIVLFRAKCHFDNHDMERSRADARAALQLCPSDDEATQLLATLSLPPTNIARL